MGSKKGQSAERAEVLFAVYLERIENESDPKVDDLLERAGDERTELEERIKLHRTLAEIAAFTEDDPNDAVELPESIGPYEIRGLLGEGGIAYVFRAWDPSLAREVALKVVRNSSLVGKRERNMLHREARTLQELEHPNIVRVYDVGVADGRDYVAMELVEGPTLEQVIEALSARFQATEDSSHIDERASAEAQRLASYQARAGVIRDVAGALAYVHDRGVLHRDVKPGNILIDAEGRPRLVDFGLVHIKDGKRTLVNITKLLFGTPAYLAPEQVRKNATLASPPTDIYALGLTLYELLAFGNPFHFPDDPAETYRAIVDEEPELPSKIDPAVPRNLERIAMRAIEKKPERRYDSIAELATDLGAFIDNRTPSIGEPTLREALGRWARRHRTGLIRGGVLSVVAASALAVQSVRAILRIKDEARTFIARSIANPLETRTDFETAYRDLIEAEEQLSQGDEHLGGVALTAGVRDELQEQATQLSMELKSRIAAFLEVDPYGRYAEREEVLYWIRPLVLDGRFEVEGGAYETFGNRGRVFTRANPAHMSTRLFKYSKQDSFEYYASPCDMPLDSLPPADYRIDYVDDRTGLVVGSREFCIRHPLAEPIDVTFIEPDRSAAGEMIDVPSTPIVAYRTRFGLEPIEGYVQATQIENKPYYDPEFTLPAYSIMSKPVTWGQMRTFFEQRPSIFALYDRRMGEASDDHPARVSGLVAQAYAFSLGMRLPTPTEINVAAGIEGFQLRAPHEGLLGEWTFLLEDRELFKRNIFVYELAEKFPEGPRSRWLRSYTDASPYNRSARPLGILSEAPVHDMHFATFRLVCPADG